MQVFKDYIAISRLDKPIGIWLLLFPGYMGLTFSLSAASRFWLFCVFAVGAWAMRGAGCIYNDIVDRKFDAKVSRTQGRPLVRNNQPLSLKTAVIFLLVHLAIGAACLILLTTKTICVGFFAAVLIFTYPWMKRITYWPQLFLGFTMNMGFIMGSVETSGTLTWGVILFYAGLVVWTLGYDTIYGFQDMEDDAVIGVRSSTFRVERFSQFFIFCCYVFSTVVWILAGVSLQFNWVYFLFVAAAGAILLWQAVTLEHKNDLNCLVRFRSNQWVGLLLWLAIVLHTIL